MKTRLSYFILASNRSGGTLLSEILRNTGVAGHISEHFLHKYEGSYRGWSIVDYPSYVRKVVDAATTPNGVYGVRVLAGEYGSIEDIVRRLRQSPENNQKNIIELINEFFPNPKFIHLIRRDKIAQAISWWRASETRLYHSIQGKQLEEVTHISHSSKEKKKNLQEPEYNFSKINEFLQSIILQEAAHQEILSQMEVTPYNIIYEDYIIDLQRNVENVLGFLEVTLPKDYIFKQPTLRKLADDKSAEWEQRYREEVQQDWPYRRW